MTLYLDWNKEIEIHSKLSFCSQFDSAVATWGDQTWGKGLQCAQVTKMSPLSSLVMQPNLTCSDWQDMLSFSGWSWELTPAMSKTIFCSPMSSCPVEIAMKIRWEFCWEKYRAAFSAGQGGVWICVGEDWGRLEDQPWGRGLMHKLMWLIIFTVNYSEKVCRRLVNRWIASLQVNRARYMPQNPSVIATKTPTSEVGQLSPSLTPFFLSGACFRHQQAERGPARPEWQVQARVPFEGA